ncbi:MAG: hypothetical protein AABX11_07770 [Nanoarchaeota archaeon]
MQLDILDDPEDLPVEIFRHASDLFVTVNIHSGGFQDLKMFQKIQGVHPREWITSAGPGGIGQYSLVNRKPAGVLARFDVHFRNPTLEEMQEDLSHYGDQVVGPGVNEVQGEEARKYEKCPVFGLLGKKHYFTGPSRIVKSVFLSRFFQGNAPENISPFIEMVDAIAEKGEMIVPQGYQFLHAVDGRINYLPFGKPEQYSTSKLAHFGNLEMDGDNIIFFAGQDRSHPMDLTGLKV